MFLGNSASLHSGVEMGTDELSGKPDEMLLCGGGGEGGVRVRVLGGVT